MSILIARTYSGGKDLFYGIPDLQGALVKDITYKETSDNYETTLVMEKKNGELFNIMIVQEV